MCSIFSTVCLQNVNTRILESVTVLQMCFTVYTSDTLEVPRQNVRRRNVRRQNVRGQNIRGDKTSVGTKCPQRQNVRRTKRPWGQNVRRTKHLADKMSVGTKRPWTKHPSGSYLPGPCQAKIFTDKRSIEREGGKIRQCPHSLSVGGCFVPRTLCLQPFCLRTFCLRMFCPYGRFVSGRFVWAPVQI